MINFKNKENLNNGLDDETSKPVRDQLMRPFFLGWKREVVMRVITVNNNCDIYYLHPSGKKLRSMAEVKANLTDGLTPDCFTFKKQPLNVSSEIVRKAVARGREKKKKSVKKVMKSDMHPQVQSRSAGLRKLENSKCLPSGAQRQHKGIRTRQQQQQNKDIGKRISKTYRNAKEKTDEQPSKRSACFIRSSARQKISEIGKRSNDSVKSNGAQLKVVDPITSQNVQCDIINTGRKRPHVDIRSIVHRNIGKYRELRKKQIMVKMKEGLEDQRSTLTCGRLRKAKRATEPISHNLHIYLKPFEKGWRRELVRRVNGPYSAGRSDVYYFHPDGKKLRSSREIANNLTHDLTVECFTFRKEALGCGEPYEVIRNARISKNYIPTNEKTIS